MFVVFAGITLPGCTGLTGRDIKFMGYGVPYATKPDFAHVEHELPLGSPISPALLQRPSSGTIRSRLIRFMRA